MLTKDPAAVTAAWRQGAHAGRILLTEYLGARYLSRVASSAKGARLSLRWGTQEGEGWRGLEVLDPDLVFGRLRQGLLNAHWLRCPLADARYKQRSPIYITGYSMEKIQDVTERS
jgi:hypothetical protein